jgi:cell division protein FtsZ
MSAAGSALMAIGEASGDTRAVEAAQIAIASPLLDIDISGARGVLFNITGGIDMTLFEVNEAADIISQAAHPDANIIFGAVQDANFDGHVKITVIATGFDNGTGRPQPTPYATSRSMPDYDRSKLYNVSAPAGGTNNANVSPRSAQSQGAYNLPPVTPPVNMANHPTGPLPTEPSAQRNQNQNGLLPAQTNQTLIETGHHRAFTPPPPEPRVDVDEDEDEYELEKEASAIEDSHQRLPAPEPEPQASPQRPGGQQRHVRRLDRGAADGARGNRNGSSGDVIDIPAFLRKR